VFDISALTQQSTTWGVDIRWGTYWCHLANMIEPSVWQRCGFMSNYFDHLLNVIGF